jgi:4-amino-4-deoxy-L-arabinose transferase-like glycosyltransferase
MTARRYAWPLFLVFGFIFSLQVLPRIFEDSPSADEVVNITDGYYYWKGDVISDSLHPPLAKGLQALPLWALGLHRQSGKVFPDNEKRDFNFFFGLNPDQFELMTALARAVTFLMGLGIGFLLFQITRGESLPFRCAALLLWAFEPALLAFSGLSLSDVPLTFFFLAAVWTFQRALERRGKGTPLEAGLFSAAAILSKFSGVLLLPLFFLLEARHVGAQKLNWKKAGKSAGPRWGIGLAAVLGLIFAAYLPGTFFCPDHQFPFAYFIHGFTSMAGLRGWPNYFKGVLGTQYSPAYYPTAFCVKSPLSFLILLAAALFLAAARRVKIPLWHWLPPFLFFVAIMPFHDLGIREILPVYPFCILIAARAGEWMWNYRPEGSRVFPLFLAGLLLFQAASVGGSFPSQISYFNEWIAPDRKLYWLGDSNLDIGQDTKRFSEEARRRGWSHVKLAYMGITDPALYGLRYQSWTQKDLQGPQPGWVYAINAEFIQLGPAFDPAAGEILKSWILKVPPTGRIGDTWYYVEIPGQVQADHSPGVVSAPFFKPK